MRRIQQDQPLLEYFGDNLYKQQKLCYIQEQNDVRVLQPSVQTQPPNHSKKRIGKVETYFIKQKELYNDFNYEQTDMMFYFQEQEDQVDKEVSIVSQSEIISLSDLIYDQIKVEEQKNQVIFQFDAQYHTHDFQNHQRNQRKESITHDYQTEKLRKIKMTNHNIEKRSQSHKLFHIKIRINILIKYKQNKNICGRLSFRTQALTELKIDIKSPLQANQTITLQENNYNLIINNKSSKTP
ncbi:hypothetical protein pb186bvf_014236 [Paramecium bursaria]